MKTTTCAYCTRTVRYKEGETRPMFCGEHRPDEAHIAFDHDVGLYRVDSAYSVATYYIEAETAARHATALLENKHLDEVDLNRQ